MDAPETPLQSRATSSPLRGGRRRAQLHRRARAAAHLRVRRADELPRAPELVVLPASTEEVVAVVKLAARGGHADRAARRRHRPVRRRAARRRAAWSSALSRMKRILEVDLENGFDARPAGRDQPRRQQAHLGRAGYYYAPDPSSQSVCTIGGNVAENSGGAHCLKYGFTVEPRARRAHRPRRRRRSSTSAARCSMRPATICSACSSAARARWASSPRWCCASCASREATRTFFATFPSTDEAGNARLARSSPSGIVPAAIEMMDRLAIAAVKAATGVDWPDVGAALLMDVDGPRAEVEHTVARRRVELARQRRRASRSACPRDDGERAAHVEGAQERLRRRWAGISPNYIVQDGVIPRSEIAQRAARDRASSRGALGCASPTSSTPATATCTRWCSTTRACPGQEAARRGAGRRDPAALPALRRLDHRRARRRRRQGAVHGRDVHRRRTSTTMDARALRVRSRDGASTPARSSRRRGCAATGPGRTCRTPPSSTGERTADERGRDAARPRDAAPTRSSASRRGRRRAGDASTRRCGRRGAARATGAPGVRRRRDGARAGRAARRGSTRSCAPTALDRIVEYAPLDQIVTVEAGVTLARAADARSRRTASGSRSIRRSPEPRDASAALVATERLRPAAHAVRRASAISSSASRSSAPTARVARGGGKVVKNVAGFDLPKLMRAARSARSGLIATATFRLHPLPEAATTRASARGLAPRDVVRAGARDARGAARAGGASSRSRARRAAATTSASASRASPRGVAEQATRLRDAGRARPRRDVLDAATRRFWARARRRARRRGRSGSSSPRCRRALAGGRRESLAPLSRGARGRLAWSATRRSGLGFVARRRRRRGRSRRRARGRARARSPPTADRWSSRRAAGVRARVDVWGAAAGQRSPLMREREAAASIRSVASTPGRFVGGLYERRRPHARAASTTACTAASACRRCPTYQSVGRGDGLAARPHLPDARARATGRSRSTPTRSRALRPLPRLHGLRDGVPVGRAVRRRSSRRRARRSSTRYAAARCDALFRGAALRAACRTRAGCGLLAVCLLALRAQRPAAARAHERPARACCRRASRSSRRSAAERRAATCSASLPAAHAGGGERRARASALRRRLRAARLLPARERGDAARARRRGLRRRRARRAGLLRRALDARRPRRGGAGVRARR